MQVGDQTVGRTDSVCFLKSQCPSAASPQSKRDQANPIKPLCSIGSQIDHLSLRADDARSAEVLPLRIGEVVFELHLVSGARPGGPRQHRRFGIGGRAIGDSESQAGELERRKIRRSTHSFRLNGVAKTSSHSLKFPGTRSDAQLSKNNVWPSPLKIGKSDRPFAAQLPRWLTLISVVAPVWRSQRKISGTPLVSFGTKLDAALR